MQYLVEIIISPFFTAIIASIATLLVSRLTGVIGNSRDEMDALKEGMRTLLRNELVAAHREWYEEKEYITLEALEFCHQTYEAYHGLGGNGSGDKLFNDIKSLPVKR